MGLFRRDAACLAVLVLSGCATGLAPIQDAVTKFDQGSKTAATAEENFFNAVYTADCTNMFYVGAASYALGTASNFDLTGACPPQDRTLTIDEVHARAALTDAIALYADKLAALATADNDKTLGANFQKLASNANALTKTLNLLPNAGVASAVEAAIVEVAKIALDLRISSEIKSAAQAMQPKLAAVVDLLKVENSTFANNVAGSTGAVPNELRQIIAATHKSRGAMSFFDVIAARQIVSATNPFDSNEAAYPHGDITPPSDPLVVADKVNTALDALVKANNAIATADSGGIIAAVDDLVARAKDAISIRNALNQ